MGGKKAAGENSKKAAGNARVRFTFLPSMQNITPPPLHHHHYYRLVNHNHYANVLKSNANKF